MLLMVFSRWWYTEGWHGTIWQTRRRLKVLASDFSLVILIKTLFAPWKQLDAYGGGGSLDARFRAWLDKSISRFIGFVIRSLTILAAFLSLVLLLVTRVLWIMLWPLLPPAVLVLIFLGLGAAIR